MERFLNEDFEYEDRLRITEDEAIPPILHDHAIGRFNAEGSALGLYPFSIGATSAVLKAIGLESSDLVEPYVGIQARDGDALTIPHMVYPHQ